MKKQQYVVAGAGFLLLLVLFFFGNTIPPKKQAVEPVSTDTSHKPKAVDVQKLLTHAKERLTPEQLNRITALENSISRGDVRNQQIRVYQQLAAFWRDTIHLFEPYAYYTSEAAKLENSEKSLTFAAHLFLGSLFTEQDPAMQNWTGTNAKVLFEKALAINPSNDSSIVGLGACYIFGNVSDNPMTGIGSIRQVLQKDSTNVFAHKVLGLGGIKSGQLDKAIGHFLVVVKSTPDDLEAMLNLAETYDRHGDKPEAVYWYREVRKKIGNPEAQKELDDRIKAIQ